MMTILRKTEKALVRLICRVKLVDRKNSEELMEMLGLKETLDEITKVNGVMWYRHMVSRDDESILRRAMMLEVNGQQSGDSQSRQGRGKLKRM